MVVSFEIRTVRAKTEPSTFANRTRLTSKWRTNDDNNSASGIRVSQGARRGGGERRAARAVAAAATVTSGSVSSMGLNWTKGETETRSSIKLQPETAGLGTIPRTPDSAGRGGMRTDNLDFCSRVLE